jgi:hypothetical protein
MGFDGRAMPSAGSSGVKHSAIGLWSSEKSVSQSHFTKLDLADYMKTLPAPMHSANCKVWCGWNNGLGQFLMV